MENNLNFLYCNFFIVYKPFIGYGGSLTISVLLRINVLAQMS